MAKTLSEEGLGNKQIPDVGKSADHSCSRIRGLEGDQTSAGKRLQKGLSKCRLP